MNNAVLRLSHLQQRPVILQSHQRAGRFALYWPRERRLKERCVWWRWFNRTQSVDGWYGRIGPVFAGLYRRDHTLRLMVDGEDLPIDAELEIGITESGVNRSFHVRNRGREVLSFDYRRPRGWPPSASDLTGFIEEEQFDIGLFIRNVVVNPERQRVLLNEV